MLQMIFDSKLIFTQNPKFATSMDSEHAMPGDAAFRPTSDLVDKKIESQPISGSFSGLGPGNIGLCNFSQKFFSFWTSFA